MRLPSWWLEFQKEILSSLHARSTIKHYTIFHDFGKPTVRVVDTGGKVHFPQHAEASRQFWINHFGDNDVARLIGLDMVMHTEKKEQIAERNLSLKDSITLLVVALAELHANAELFGGIASTSFKIKYRHLEKVGKSLCQYYFQHPYLYVLVRRDLSNAQKAVQSAHAVVEAARAYIKPGDIHPSIIICEVKNEQKLKMVMEELCDKVPFQVFREPDRGMEITAIASAPVIGEQRKLFARFQLIS
jgi:hypothetical protein